MRQPAEKKTRPCAHVARLDPTDHDAHALPPSDIQQGSPRIPRSKGMGDMVRGVGGILVSRDTREPEFQSLEPRGIRYRRVKTFINFRSGRLQESRASRKIGFSRTYLHGFFFFLLKHAAEEANPKTEPLTLPGSYNDDPALFRNSVLLSLGFPMFESTGGRGAPRQTQRRGDRTHDHGVL
jgi:hypothetical protein